MTYQSLTISKLDAAKRQLETAVTLYFNHGDPVSIHTLAAAGYNVIRDVNSKRGGEKMVIKDRSLEHVKPEMRRKFADLMNEAENFFKHADRDHDATLDFNPTFSEAFLFEACAKYWELTGEHPPLFQTYRGWFMVTNQKLFDVPERWQGMLRKAAEITSDGRSSYFKDALP